MKSVIGDGNRDVGGSNVDPGSWALFNARTCADADQTKDERWQGLRMH